MQRLEDKGHEIPERISKELILMQGMEFDKLPHREVAKLAGTIESLTKMSK